MKIMTRPPRPSCVPAVAAILAALCGVVALAGAAVRPELRPWPGPGFQTERAPLMRVLDPDVAVTSLLTVGDSLLAPTPEAEDFIFLPAPDGIGVQSLGRGLAEVYVTHQTTWEDGVGGGRVSRLLFDADSRRILAGDWVVDGIESYERLGSAFLADTHDGFLTPTFLINEGSTQGPSHGVVAAVNVRSGFVTELPGLGRFRHAMTLLLPITNGKVIAILTEEGDPGRSQLYMYIADSDADFLAGNGDLYVLRADPPAGRPDTQSSAMVKKSRPPLTGRFVPVRGYAVHGDPAVAPSVLEAATRAAGSLNFVRLGDAAPDRRNPSAFYVADTGDETFMDPVSGRPVTGDGRIYRIELDPFDPTLVKEIRVILDGDEADDIYRPNDLDTDEHELMVQEDPGRRGIHPSRILRYNLDTRRLDVLAECAERDPQGRFIPEGTGGLWRTAGIVDASDVFGPGAWLIAVQARNDRTTVFGNRGGGGQLLLLRTPEWTHAKAAGKSPKAEKGATKAKE